ncbi:neural cell adhesion molecule 1-A-like isoform X2 [Acanthochromis polyacanthus]|uniref:neural cell adhesion molecule 1-A-like isoform X2 n=1 Tax=Acanthochromis polyacanthus TaxID=80966 RepID=UPI0022341962|nr:neural cell adhesion molecule 1-A-like isoform X2 [Acanthochromis polyacanthus]
MLQIRDLIWGLLFIGCAAAIQVQITPTQGEISVGKSKFFLCEVLPTIRARQSEVNATADVGSSALLACDADGFPEPTVTWAHNNVVLETGDKYSLNGDGSELEIRDVKKVDEGDYTCIAKNKAGEKSEEVSLNVFDAPKILGSVTVYTWEGNPANISCEVDAHPGAEVVWFRDGLQLPNANTTNMKVYNTPTISYLEITPDSQNDFGSYNCTATNVMGAESKEFILIQAEVPSSPEIQQVEPFSSTAVVEFEEPVSMGGVPIIKYRVEWRSLGQEWSGREYDAEDGET